MIHGDKERNNETNVLVSTLHVPVTFTHVISFIFATVMQDYTIIPILQRRHWDL